MKKQYNIKDAVWIHIGERSLVEGRVVDIIDLEHLNEGHDPTRELYIIEVKTGIDDIYEVRDFETISPDKFGPIGLFRNKTFQQEVIKGNRYLKSLGVRMPANDNPLVELAKEIEGDPDDPTPEQINAVLEKSVERPATIFNPTLTKKKPTKKRPFQKRRTKDANT